MEEKQANGISAGGESGVPNTDFVAEYNLTPD
jgi:serine/threonine-protein phosphatase PP1 catalytic subunit